MLQANLYYLFQILSDLMKASLQRNRENGVRVGYALPYNGDLVPQILTVGVQHFGVCNLQNKYINNGNYVAQILTVGV